MQEQKTAFQYETEVDLGSELRKMDTISVSSDKKYMEIQIFIPKCGEVYPNISPKKLLRKKN